VRTVFYSFVALLLSVVAGPVWAQPIELLTNMDYPPYIVADAPGGGLHTEIVRESYRAVGRELQIRVMPWKRITRELTDGKALGSFSWADSEERRTLFLVSMPIFFSNAVIFTRLENFSGTEDVPARAAAGQETVMCRPHGWTTPRSAAAQLEAGTLRLTTPEKLRSCFELMIAGRADYVDVPTLAAWHVLQTLINESDNPDAIRETIHVVHPENPFGGTSHILFTRTVAGEQARQEFAKGMAIIAENGALEAIIARHLAPYPDLDKTAILEGLRRVGVIAPTRSILENR